MCGFAGCLSVEPGGIDLQVSRTMAGAIRHRGPDDEGSWMDSRRQVAFGFRRLSILDLSHNGHQPMTSASGRFTIVFNGEIYNFRNLRSELEQEGHRFHGGSDTEVALGAFERWGVRNALQRFEGMFAMALWDDAERALILIRDRFGKKPLYYGWKGGQLIFGSELKALKQHPAFDSRIDDDAFAAYLRNGWVPGPLSIYAGLAKLPAGTYLRIAAKEPKRDHAPVKYWDFRQLISKGRAEPFRGSEEEALDRLDKLLGDAVSSRLVADVPVGAFLSGGIDSSIVVAIAQARTGVPCRTFSVGFEDVGFDESLQAARTAKALGTVHTPLRVTAVEGSQIVPDLPAVFDEPFADASSIPMLLVSKLARRSVTVALSGDGGDEMFGGYNRHLVGRHVPLALKAIPRPVRALVAKAFSAVPARTLDGIAAVSSRLTRSSRSGDRLEKLVRALPVDTPAEFYDVLLSGWDQIPHAVAKSARHLPAADAFWDPALSVPENYMALDTTRYLTDDVLVKVDRATMANSLEARAPFLDRAVAGFAWSLPLELRIRDGQGKWLVRRLLERYLPRNGAPAAKQGFTVPLHRWLRGPMRDWVEGLLAPERLSREGFEVAAVRSKWDQHLRGERNWQQQLWIILSYLAWKEHACALARA